MTIPNVTISWCQHQALCDWCPKHIESGQPMIVVFYWNKGSKSHSGFNTKKYYHPQCWLDQGMDYLKRNPFVSTHKGAKRLDLTPEQKLERNKILRRKGAIEYRRSQIDHSLPNHKAIEAKMNIQIVDLMIEIAPLGGVPKKWLERYQV